MSNPRSRFVKGPLTIIGPGVLGRSLAGWAALQGFEVRLVGRDLPHATLGKERVEQEWRKAQKRGRLSQEDLETASTRLKAYPTWGSALEGTEILLEALPENQEIKAHAWQILHSTASENTLRLTGSSSLPIASLAKAAGMDSHLLGFHLFVPVNRMHLVELVIPEGFSPPLSRRAEIFGRDLGLQVVHVRDVPGYAASRMALAQGLEAMRLLEEGVASAEDIDSLMVKGYGHPMGPLALSDHIGLDLRLTIAEVLFQATGNPRYEPPEVLRSKVAQGLTGRKVGQGFYDWEARGSKS